MLQPPTFHLAAFRGSLATGTVNGALAGVPDQALARSLAGNFLVPDSTTIRYGATGGVNLQRTRINTAALREIALPYIDPVNQTLAVPTPANFADLGPVGIKPRTADEIFCEATHSDAATQVIYALLWMQFAYVPQRQQKEYRVRFTAAITAVAGAWASGGITFDQSLPAGTYQITGLDVFGTNLLGARLIFPGASFRPGVMARNAVNAVPTLLGTDGRLGVFGEFNSTAPPQLEIYAEAANTVQEGYVDLIRTGDYAPQAV